MDARSIAFSGHYRGEGGGVSLVAFKGRNHPQQRIRDEVNDRRTPREFFDALNIEHSFTVDAAASNLNALLPLYWTLGTDGLAQSWAGHRVWCNPPYTGLEAWVEKAWIEMVDGSAESVTMLLPANRCEQGWWQRHVEPYRDGGPFHGVTLKTRFLPNRMRFGWQETRPRPTPLRRHTPLRSTTGLKAVGAGAAKRRERYQKAIHSPHWRAIRVIVLRRARGLCEWCQEPTARFQLHHITYKRLGKEWPDDVVALCRGCHERHHYHRDFWKRRVFKPRAW